MNGRFLLDTNIVIALFAKDASVEKNLITAEQIFIPSIVLGELYYGAYKSSKVTENIVRIDEFADKNVILKPDNVTAKNYGEIKNKLLNKGYPIPENDIWVAAIAKQYNLILVTRDEHFKEIEGITRESW